MAEAMSSKLAQALLKVQQEIGDVEKGADNPYFKSKYADLSSVIDVIKPVLNKNGIVFIQFPVPAPFEGHLALTTVLLHESGESVSGTAVVPLAKADPQAYGGAMTYARRYSLVAITGLKQVDDDGEAAMGRGEATTPTAPKAEGAKFRLGFNKRAEGKAEAPQRGKTSLFPKVGGGKKPAVTTITNDAEDQGEEDNGGEDEQS